MIDLEEHEKLKSYKLRTIDLPVVLSTITHDYKHDSSWSWASIIDIALNIGKEKWDSNYLDSISIIVVKVGGNGITGYLIELENKGIILKST